MFPDFKQSGQVKKQIKVRNIILRYGPIIFFFFFDIDMVPEFKQSGQVKK